MRKSQAFQPTGLDRLETREVPSTVFTGLEYKHLTREIDLAFKRFAAAYGTAIYQVPVHNGVPDPAAVTKFRDFVANREQVLSGYLYDMAHHRVPFGQQGLGQSWQAEVSTMDSTLASATTIQEALHPGATIDTARRAVLNDLGNFLVSELKAGNIRIINS